MMHSSTSHSGRRAATPYGSLVDGWKPIGGPGRQRAALEQIADAARQFEWLRALLVVGSMAASTADALSDLDLLVIVHEGQFADAWQQRGLLHVTEALCAWDQRPDESREAAAHRWLTPELILVEALMATASSGVRLAQPWLVAAGDEGAADELAPRPPIKRSEMSGSESHPVEQAYDEFKRSVRRACV